MEHKPPILPNHFYHIYNRGNNKSQIFFNDVDYAYFIHLMKIFLLPIADIYSYALMLNHLHIALRIKDDAEIGWLDPANATSEDLATKWKTSTETSIICGSNARKPSPDRMIQHLFSTYSKSLNARYHRTGNLMEDRFERKIVASDNQLRRLICYINCNPEKHNVNSISEYPWTSYLDLVNDKPCWFMKDLVFELFGDKESFILALKKTDFDDWLNVR